MPNNFTPLSIYDGRDLMLFDANNHSFAYSTNHQLTLNIETQSIASKDHGIFGASSVSNISWEITSENLATEEYNEIFAMTLAHEPITVRFGLKTPTAEDVTVADGDLEYWTLDTTTVGNVYYEGKAIITSLQLNAPNGEKASYSITLSGVGKLEPITVTQ